MFTNNPNPENTNNSEEKPDDNEKKDKLKSKFYIFNNINYFHCKIILFF